MSDNELLLVLSDMLDKKIKPVMEEITDTKKEMYAGFSRINMILENEIQKDIKLLAENYLPAAKSFEKASRQIEQLQADVNLLKKVVTEHSEKLKQIS